MRLIFQYIKKRKLLLFLNILFAFSFIFAEIGIPFFESLTPASINAIPKQFFPDFGSLSSLVY